MPRIRTRLVFALLAASLLPLAASGVLVRVVLDRALAIGLNPQIEEELKYSLNLAKRLHRNIKSQWELTLVTIPAPDDLATYPDVEAAAVYDRSGRCHFVLPSLAMDPINCPDLLFEEVKTNPPLYPQAWDDPDNVDRIWVWQSEFPDFLKAVAVRIDGSHRQRFEESRSLLLTYEQIARLRHQILQASVLTYLALLAVVVLFAILIGRRIARRVTDGLDRLIEATEAVAKGDMTWRVPVEGRDELAKLAGSFNRMTSEVDQSRARIVFLEKTAHWQDVARKLAHQIKNPLTPITLVAQQMHDSYKGDDPVYKALLDKGQQIIREETATLKTLVDSFSAFARLPKAEPQPHDLGAFLTEQAVRYPEINDRLEVTLDIEPGLPPVGLDIALMKGALYNLLENAAQACALRPDAKGKIRIKAQRAPGRSGMVRVTVADNGPGIPPEMLTRIFEPYFTTKPSGSGLGLAVARKILIDHGGDLRAESNKGGGAVFILEFRISN